MPLRWSDWYKFGEDRFCDTLEGRCLDPDRSEGLFTDGVTWRDRTSDLRKLVDMQNRGAITRIYTMSMAEQLEADLMELKREHAL